MALKSIPTSSRAALLLGASLGGAFLQMLLVFTWVNRTEPELYATFLSITASNGLIGAISRPALNTLAERFGAYGDLDGLRTLLIKKIAFCFYLLPIFIITLLATNQYDHLFVFLSILAFFFASVKSLVLSYCVGLKKTTVYVLSALLPQAFLCLIVYVLSGAIRIEYLPVILVVSDVIPILFFLRGILRAKKKELCDDDISFENSASKTLSLNILLKGDKLLVRYLLGDVGLVSYQICMTCMQVCSSIQSFIVKLLTPQIVLSPETRSLFVKDFGRWMAIFILASLVLLFLVSDIWAWLFSIFFQDYAEIKILAYFFFGVSVIALPAGLYFNFIRIVGNAKGVSQYTYVNLSIKFLGLALCGIFGLEGIATAYIFSAVLSIILVHLINISDKRCI